MSDLALRRQLKKKHPRLEDKNFQKGSVKFHKTSSELGNTLEVLRGQMSALKREIRADRAGKKEFEDQISLLKRKRELLEKNYNANAAWAKGFDASIGPFEAKYAGLTTEIGGLYDNAKLQHANGIKLLVDEFRYHPTFKRWNDDFSAVPFRPK